MKTRALNTFFALAALVALAAAVGFACSPADFAPEQQIASVRILATRADRDAVYAHPGETVTLESLVVDGRPNPTPPVKLYWVPLVCENPTNDEYYACFAATPDGGGVTAGVGAGIVPGVIDASVSEDAGGDDDAGAGANADANAGANADAGADANADADANAHDAGDDDAGPGAPPPSSPTLTFTVPMDTISKHPVLPGTPPYGLMIAFNVACAGHLKITSIDPSAGPQQVPIACVDDAGNTLGPDDYVIGFTRVYVYETTSNKNPEIDGIVINGVETKTGVVGTALPNVLDVDVPPCTKSCGSLPITVDVPPSSWEVDPNNKDSDGNPEHESIWVDYYAIGGNLESEARLLYDARAGQITGTGSTVNYDPPLIGTTTLWAVVHDNRDGATWLQVNVHAK
jgi:hypothetical protein